MSVTTAARLMGVGRPALSNLLNGNAALSPDMAARLEQAFKKLGRKELLDMQAAYDASLAKKKAPTDIKAYVPPFLGITANQIEEYFGRKIPARTRLAVFLRTLVHSSVRGLLKVDFPGNDDAERAGWDGYIEAGEGNTLDTNGTFWSGNSALPRTSRKKQMTTSNKALKALEKSERDDTTFVFVTPRRWPRKGIWVADARAKARWKDVRAYDSSDLEQWLEQSIPAQVWFANETQIPAKNVRSLDKCWADWANIASPPLTGALFNSAIDATKRILTSRLSNAPDGSIVMTADSSEEALAFLAQVFSDRGGDESVQHRDRVLIFDVPGVLPIWRREHRHSSRWCTRARWSVNLRPLRGRCTPS